MTNAEFSDSFDTLLNSYSREASFSETSSPQSIVLDEYEKSIFLTEAQKDIVLSLYNGKNPYGEAFEGTEETRRYLSSLVSEDKLKPIANDKGVPYGVSSSSKFFTLPQDLWFITMESVILGGEGCRKGTAMKVYPTKQDEYQNIKDNPFRGANDRRALRLDLSDGVVEIICKYDIDIYYIRYVKKLSPIVLVDLPDGLSIDGESKNTECHIHEALHHKILERSVALALQSKGYGLAKESGNN